MQIGIILYFNTHQHCKKSKYLNMCQENVEGKMYKRLWIIMCYHVLCPIIGVRSEKHCFRDNHGKSNCCGHDTNVNLDDPVTDTLIIIISCVFSPFNEMTTSGRLMSISGWEVFPSIQGLSTWARTPAASLLSSSPLVISARLLTITPHPCNSRNLNK